jgi:hypothetical protein
MASAAYVVRVRVPPRVSVEQLLCAFYNPVLELARLAQASAVEASLDAAADRAEGRDRWRLCCELPTLLEKLWADLYELRRGVPAAERRRVAAPAALVEGCLHVHARLGEAVAVVSQALAVRFVGRLVALDAGARGAGARDAGARDAGARDAGARDAGARDAVAALWARGDARGALAQYLAGQMREGWAAGARQAAAGPGMEREQRWV